MKISSANWNVSNTENLYKNIKEKLTEKTEVKQTSTNKDTHIDKFEEKKYGSLDSVLSEKEINTLRVLFGEEKSNIDLSFYGRNKPKNVHSGFFLDVKG